MKTVKHIDKRITHTLVHLSNVRIKITVPLVQQDGKSILTDWSREVNSTLTEHSYHLEAQAYLVIENSGKNNDVNLDWKKRSLYISPRTQAIVAKAFDDIVKIMYDEKNDPYYLDAGRLKAHTLTDDQIIHVDTIGDDNVFELRPSVDISEDGSKDFEGAALSINSVGNTMFLYLDEIETIRHILRHTDIPMLAMGLIDLYFTYKEKAAVGKVVYQSKDVKPKRKLFVEDETPPDKESVADIGMATDDPFSDLEEKDENQ